MPIASEPNALVQISQRLVMIDTKASIKRSLAMPDARLRLLEEKFKIGTWSMDLETMQLWWSPGIFKILGLTTDSVVPTLDLYQQMVHPEDQLAFTDAVALAMSPSLDDRRFRIIRPDGSLCWLENRTQRHFDREGKPILVSGVVADVSEEENLRTRLLHKTKQERLLHELLGELVWRARPDGRLIDTRTWTELTGETATDAHDWDALAAIHPDDRDVFKKAWSEAVRSTERYTCSLRIRLRDGHYQRCYSKALPFKNEDGSVEFWLGVSTFWNQEDVPQQKMAITAAHVRAARSLLDWTAQKLAMKAAVSFSSIRRLETDFGSVKQETVDAVLEALTAAGIRFTVDEAGAIAIALRRP